MGQALDQWIVWLGLSLRLPAEWELVGHSLSPRKGRLMFADRRRQRMQVNWTACRIAPPIDKMLGDYRAKAEASDHSASLEDVVLGADAGGDGDWDAVVHTLDDGRSVVRTARYSEPTKRLIELVVSDPTADGEAQAMAEAVTSAMHISPADGEAGDPRWRAWGIDATPPSDGSGWFPAAVEVVPGRTSLEWHRDPGGKHRRDRENPDVVRVTRSGMARAWFKHDLDNHLRTTLTRGERKQIGESHAQRYRGRQAAVGETVEQAVRLRRWLRLARVRQDLVWHEPSDNAVFQITTLTGRRRPVDPADVVAGPAQAAPPLEQPGPGEYENEKEQELRLMEVAA
jgi:hypothetical protein